MNKIKNYVKNNSQTLFKSVDTMNNIVFDNRGFLFSDKAQAKYNEICDLPHIYVAWVDGNDGFLYIGKSFQKGGRWKRSHAYHLGTLAYHLLNTMQSDDQNHQHWIDSWMKTETMKLGHSEHFIHLIKEVKICFIPFEIYSEKELSKLDSIEIREINKKIETTLIQSYLNDGFKLLNVQNNINLKSANKKILKSAVVDTSINKDSLKNNLKCIGFKVKKAESAHEKIQNTNLQSDLIYLIDIFETTNTQNFICEYYNKTKIPFKYFGNADTSSERLINGKESARWKVIQKLMNENNINEVTIRLCPIGNNSTASNKIKPDNKPNKPVMKTNENEKLNISNNIKVVMICAGSKFHEGELKIDNHFINFIARSNRDNYEFLPDDLIEINGKKTWRDFVNENQPTLTLKAYELYKKKQYRCLYNKYGNNFFILSAGWGLVNAEFKLPYYDITFSQQGSINTKRNKNMDIPPLYKDYNHLVPNDNDDIIYIGGKDYLDLFYKLTSKLSNRKIIYYNSNIMPENHDGNYIYRKYLSNYPTNWHYQLADDICNGIIP